MDSRQKVFKLREYLRTLTPEDERDAQMLQILIAITPLLAKAIPEDPQELDSYLRTIAVGAAMCRSDDARELGVFELHLDGDCEGAWHRVEAVV